MKKKIYLRIYPKEQESLDQLLRDSMDKLSTVKNIEKIEGQVGYSGNQKSTKPSLI